MKKIKLFLIAITTLLIFNSCTKDETSETPEQQLDIKFKWFLESQTTNGNIIELSDCDKQGYIEFRENDIFERKDFYLNGLDCEIEGLDNGTYLFDTTNNKIIISFVDAVDGNQSETFDVIEINETTLKYSWIEENTFTHILEYKK